MQRACRLAAVLLAAIGWGFGGPAAAAPDGAPADAPRAQPADGPPGSGAPNGGAAEADRPPVAETLCRELGRAAVENNLPAEFFTRLIWQESRFDERSVSRAGALGIAQFMPGTARGRGLADPFEPVRALHESARLLGDLRDQFGNLGLAAAAYNAGPRRVQDWIGGRRGLPAETRAYVRIITGRTADEWAKAGSSGARSATGESAISCDEVAAIIGGARQAALPLPRPAPEPALAPVDQAAWAPWGLQLAGAWSEAQALAEYRRLQQRFPAILGDRPPLVVRGAMPGRGSAAWYRVRVAEETREGAAQLCVRLESAGGTCMVFHN